MAEQQNLDFDIPEAEPDMPAPEPAPETEAVQADESEALASVVSSPEPEPEADSELEPEVPTEEAAPEPEPEQPKMVNLAALQEERAKRRDIEARLQQQEERFQEFQKRLAAQDEAAAEPPVPDFDEDPAANLDQRLKRAEETQQQYAARMKQQEELQQTQQQLAQFASQFHAKEEAFSQQTPDYYEAVGFLRQQRGAELQALGYAPEMVTQLVDQEAVQYAITATQNGRDPVQMFYEVAKQRGYRGGAAPAAQPNLERVAQNQERAKSPGSRSSGKSAPPTLRDLASMSDEDFDKFTSGKNWSKLWS